MVTLRVSFQPYTSADWAKRKISELGLPVLEDNSRFSITVNPRDLKATVKVSDEDEIEISRALRLITRVTDVKKL